MNLHEIKDYVLAKFIAYRCSKGDTLVEVSLFEARSMT
jgi:hypothetical protein